MTQPLYSELRTVLPAHLPDIAVAGSGSLPSAFAVTELATCAMGAAAASLSELIRLQSQSELTSAVTVDRRLASIWFAWSLRPDGWDVPPPWDVIAGDYRAKNGWIKLHTNTPRHRAAALAVLGCAGDRDTVVDAVAEHDADELETAILETGGCGAVMRSLADWSRHPQGKAVAQEPLIHMAWHKTISSPLHSGEPGRPLSGVRVLDLTRVLAGPVAGRFLAGYGARVLRIDPPDWEEPGVVPEVTLGKRCAGLDLQQAEDRATFERLLGEADVLIHGYRPGALDDLGFGEDARRLLNPSLVDVSLNAYGWTGPWKGRRGFDSLVQMSSGIADHGMVWSGNDIPTPLPVQALDHATGYLMAIAVIEGLKGRVREGSALSARLSLARTAHLLTGYSGQRSCEPLEPETPADLGAAVEHTVWGSARRIGFPVMIEGCPARWELPAGPLRASPPDWP